MINIYTAEHVAFNWFMGLPLMCSWIIFFIPGIRNVVIHRRRFLYGDRYGMSFCFGLPLSIILFLVANKGFLSNEVMYFKRTVYQGSVQLQHSEPGWEDVLIGKTPIGRFKYEYSNYPTHCWQGKFEDKIKQYPNRTFRLEVAWVDGGKSYNETDKYSKAFPCILKLDVI